MSFSSNTTSAPDTVEAQSENNIARYREYRKEHPRARTFDVAQALSLSEAEITSMDLGERVIRLESRPLEILEKLEQAGIMMSLTRNPSIVHEVHGSYGKRNIHGKFGSYTEGIDLRLHTDHWCEAFAVILDKGKDQLPGIQFFNARGYAVHKSYFIEGANRQVFEDILNTYRADDQESYFQKKKSASPGFGENHAVRTMDNSERENFLEQWAELKHVHHFNTLLARNNIARLSALREVEGHYTRRLPANSHRRILEEIQEQKLEAMFFVGNTGAIQIYTGHIQNLRAMKDWYNVLDSEFNLHIHEQELGEAWTVFKPTDYGGIHSVEVYDTKGRIVLQIFGKRIEEENPSWRSFVQGLDSLKP